MAKRKKFIIVDGHALIHRAWHAIPPLTTKDGRLVNAVFGFTSVLLKAMKELKPDYLAVTFDLKGLTFRHEQYKEYKATRKKQEPELYEQIPLIKEVVEALNINIYEKQGFEADDLIGTLCDKKQVDRDDILSVIVTGDLDTLQLVDDNTEVFTFKKGMSETFTYDIKAVKQKFKGLTPAQMVDYKALRGDPSDNIKGVKGIGEKTAIDLLNEFKTLDLLYKEVENNSDKAQKLIKERIRKLLLEYKKDALLSKELATIKRDVKIDFKLEDCARRPYDKNKTMKLFSDLDFRGLFNRLPEDTKLDQRDEPDHLAGSGQGQRDNWKEKVDYKLINKQSVFDAFLTELKKQKEFVFDTETTGLDFLSEHLLGISFCWEKAKAYYVVANEDWLKELKKIFEDEKIGKIAHNFKFDAEMLRAKGIEVQNYYFDTMVASYLLNPGSRTHSLDNLAFTELQHKMISLKELIGEGKNKIAIEDVPVEQMSYYSCEDSDYTWRLYEMLKPRLEKQNLIKLFTEIEMPLIPVLVEMEFNGVKLDTDFLKQLGVKVNRKIKSLEEKIYKIAGKEFNISSPNQLQEILFDKLEISTAGLKKTKTGISTAAPELEKIKDLHEIIKLISEYRELTKLKSTYIDALPKLVHEKTGRVHTSFNQTITSTGRLSSSDPNLQNIPIRTELGREIRKAFIAERGNRLISSDYSQVELRVIACLAKDKNMMEVFERGEDIHSATAAKIFEVPLEKVDKDMRRKAKEVNFGVLYGMGAVGLARRTGISRAEAKEFIDKYFENYKQVKEYTEKMVEDARKNEFVETMFGRIRKFPEINSHVQMIRASAERMAINMPIQGTAADLMKIAMIEVFNAIKRDPFDKLRVFDERDKSRIKMLLQVHDELVIECPNDMVDKVVKIIDEKMEKIHKLCVPIKVETEVGMNWDEMKVVA